jgi:type IV pilus assembly protein PilX
MSLRIETIVTEVPPGDFVDAMANGLQSTPSYAVAGGSGKPRHCTPRSRQGGIALVVAMILLIVITLVGLAAVRGTVMQQKMTANFYDRQLAFQASEAALRLAEATVPAGTPQGSFRNCSPIATPLINCPADPFSNPATLAATPALIVPVPQGTFYQNGLGAGQPQYVIEYMGYFAVPPPKVKQLSNGPGGYQANQTTYAYFYRITATSSNPANVVDRAVVTLQSVYRR